MAVLVGLAYALKETPVYPSVPHALYQGLHRSLWALALSWIIVACEEGYGGKSTTKTKFHDMCSGLLVCLFGCLLLFSRVH